MFDGAYHLCNLDRGYYGEHPMACGIILNSDQWFRRGRTDD